MTKVNKRLWLLTSLLLVFSLAMLSFGFIQNHKTFASTGINQELSFEGKITSSTGTNITDGNYNVEFQIWNGASCNPSTGSGCTAVWTEDYLTSNGTYGTTVPVAFTSGTFQVNLGSICSLGGGSCEGNSNSAVNFNSYPLYVSINVGTTSVCSAGFSSCGGGTGVMYPLIALTSSPYSFNSNELGGIASTGYIQTNPTSSQTIQPTTNVSSLIVEQNNSGSFANDVFDVQGSSGSADDFLQVTSTAANAGAVTVQSLGSNTLSLQSGGTIKIGTVNNNDIYIGDTTNDVGIDNPSPQYPLDVTGKINTSSEVYSPQLDTASAGTLGLGGTNASIVLIGSSSATNMTQHLLQLNSNDTFADSPSTCTTTSNQGTLYYNNSSNSVRACLNGSWQDVVTSQALALQLFGVVPNSGSDVGDLIGASADSTVGDNTGGPCKVSFDTTTSVYVNSCLAYSGGRLVTIAAQAVSTASVAASSYDNLCLNSSGTPALLGSSTTLGSQTINNLSPTNSTTYGQPLLCLATILTSATAGHLSKIYDVRTYTNTLKTYAIDTTASTAVIGGTVAWSGTNGEVAQPTATTSKIAGVVVASTGAAGTVSSPNVIIAYNGPQWLLSSSGTISDSIIPTANSDVDTGATATPPTAYDTLGLVQNTYATSCTAQTYGVTDCQYSNFAYLDIQ